MFAKDFRQKARDALRGRWTLAVVTTLVATLLGAWTNYPNVISNIINNEERYTKYLDLPQELIVLLPTILVIAIIWSLIVFFIGASIDIGYCRFLLNMINDKEASFNDIFSAFSLFWRAIAMRLLMVIYTFLWFLLLIIPGILAALSYAMAPFIMAENPDIGADEAISESKIMMDGNKWRLFCLELSFIGWGILNIFTLGIGSLWLGPYISTARAAFYIEVSGKQLENA